MPTKIPLSRLQPLIELLVDVLVREIEEEMKQADAAVARGGMASSSTPLRRCVSESNDGNSAS